MEWFRQWILDLNTAEFMAGMIGAMLGIKLAENKKKKEESK
jgi:hypothetical protein